MGSGKTLMKTKILVVGGAGYIGSHMVRSLINANYEPVVFDNLSTGYQDLVPNDVLFIQGDISDSECVKEVFQQFHFGAVIHFAASSIVSDSVKHPLRYYQNNVAAFITLLEQMVRFQVSKIIFSSTAAVYGEPKEIPVTETSSTNPTNPYGRSKLMMEQILQDVSGADELSYVIFRYFNAAGADDAAEIGERHQPETHLIPNVLNAMNHPDKKLTIFGADYPTEDGTCIRDYIHIQDLCHAHVLALHYLEQGGMSEIFNLGSEKGYSIKEVIQEVESMTHQKVSVEMGSHRPGDPSKLVAHSGKAKRLLGWVPKYGLRDIIHSSYRWHSRREQLEASV